MIGMGNSGTDIAVEASHVAEKVPFLTLLSEELYLQTHASSKQCTTP